MSAAPVLVVAAAATGRAAPVDRRTPRTTTLVPQAVVPRTPPGSPPRPHPVPAGASPAPAPRGRALPGVVARPGPIQVVCWQVAVVTVVLALRQPLPALVCASIGAAVLVALTGVRVDGRWLYELAVLGVEHLSRARRRDLPVHGGTPALLDLLVPGCTVRCTETARGPAMTASHRGGLTALLRLDGAAAELLDRVPPLPGLLPVVEGWPHPFGVQLVCHAGVRRAEPARMWLAVHAARGVEAPGDEELTPALRNGLRRVRRALDRAGVSSAVLAEEAALAVIAGLAHVTGGRGEVREDWRCWRAGAVRQATFRLRGWHRLTDQHARQLAVDLLTVDVGATVTVTVAVRSGRDGPWGEGVLRLAATTGGAVEAAVVAASTRAAPYGVRLVRLDGAHARGVAASLPIGVFLP
ncbi:type VII secretion protein EccE [Micromonospora sp. LOL_025]|uniref:type VII secretion protein EccE n=1 Tax=Micromonospora sp. LOL_025 TaxID=3345413 RepID=UPI003A868819